MQTPVDIKKYTKDGALVYEFVGELDETNTDEVFRKVYDSLGDFAKRFVFDMAKLTYLNSKSIGYLADIYSHVDEVGGKMIIAACSEEVHDTLDIVGITSLIDMVDTLDEAIKDLHPRKGKYSFLNLMACLKVQKEHYEMNTTIGNEMTPLSPDEDQGFYFRGFSDRIGENPHILLQQVNLVQRHQKDLNL